LIAAQTNSVDLIKYIDRTNSMDQIFDDDIGYFEKHFGAADSSSSEIIRVLAHLIAKSNDTADKEAADAVLDLHKLKKALKLGESQQMLYETDENGLRTGRLISDLNWGKYYKAEKEEIKRINRYINEKYNLNLEDDNRQPPQDNTEAFVEWQKMRNDWKKKNSERKYIDEYYDAWAKVDYFTKESLNSYNAAIDGLLSKKGIRDEDGNIHLEMLTEEEFKQLERLRRDKALLYSDYDAYGNQKIPGTVQYEIAKQLQQL